MHYGKLLRDLLDNDGIVIAPGTHNPLSARIAERVGFDMISMTGNGTSVAKLGEPDVGLITLPEMVENAANIQETVDIPLLADADNGYGNAVNVARTVREFAKAGIAGIHIEDQVFPKRCGFVEGKQVISREEAIGKFRAAVDTRNKYDEDMIIVARTDAKDSPDGDLKEAIERVNEYCDAGADVAFVQGAANKQELEQIGNSVNAPLVYNCSGESPIVPYEQAEQWGYDIILFPRMSINPAIAGLFTAYQGLKEREMNGWREVKGALEDLPFEDYDEFSGVPEILEFEEKYLPDE
jgi:2-methylisocitrate lyase-like PEP mutase family enzyme